MPKVTKLSAIANPAPELPNEHEGETKSRLITSGVLFMRDGELTWREGHLEAVARCYQDNAVIAMRDYADDIITAQVFTPELWAALTGAE